MWSHAHLKLVEDGRLAGVIQAEDQDANLCSIVVERGDTRTRAARQASAEGVGERRGNLPWRDGLRALASCAHVGVPSSGKWAVAARQRAAL